MKKRVIDIIIAIEFLLMTIIPLFTFNWTQGKMSVSENRYLAPFPTFFSEEGNISETLADDFMNWFEDNIGMRDAMINLSSIISFNIFNKSTSDRVQIGKDGWLFYSDEHNLDIVNDTYSDFGEEKLAEFCQQQVAVQEKLKQQGIEYVLVIPASKVSVYPEYIQSGDFGIKETPADIFADYLEEHTDIKVVRLKDAMLEEKNHTEELLYFKTDSHWTHYGSYVGYKKIIEDMNNWGLIDTNPIGAEFYDAGSYSGDLANMMGVVNLKGEKFSDSSHKEINLINPHAIEIKSGEKYEQYASLMQSEGNIKYGTMWENPSIDKKNLLIYGDSMFANYILPELAENFSSLTFNWSYNFRQEMIDLVQPDIVMLDISERGLNIYLPGLFDSFLKTDIKLDKENKILDIFYCDKGELKEMYVPVWSEQNSQDDLVWYEAERVGNDYWHVKVYLNQHGSNGQYFIEFYDGPWGPGNYLGGVKYNVGNIFN